MSRRSPLSRCIPLSWLAPLAVCAVAGLTAGCERSAIEGKVTDVKGDALPGVAVRVANGDGQALTGPRGRYRVAFNPGAVQLVFVKTGYTPGRLDLVVEEPRSVTATTVKLWPLPPAQGVYLFEDYRYRQASALEPTAFLAEGQGLVHGADKAPELATIDPDPMIMCYKMPHYDVELCRLEAASVAPAAAPDPVYSETGWVCAATVPIAVDVIDEPDDSLIELRLTQFLEPGVYGVHWGALDNYTTTDRRVFLFRVEAPGTPVPEETAEPGEGP